MKKLTLKDLSFKKGEVLTRAELKNVLGGAGSRGNGSGSGSGSGSGPDCPDECQVDANCYNPDSSPQVCKNQVVTGCGNAPLRCVPATS